MGHKTLIGGTAYDITGGNTLVSGTSYSVKGGKVLVSGTEYDISFIKGPLVDVWTGSANDTIMCIAYADGYWVVGGRCYDGSTNQARIAYSTDLINWTTKDLWSGTSACVNCITYADGYWVAGGYSVSSSYYAKLAYATSLSGTWYTKNVWTKSYEANITSVAYGNGYWVVSGQYDDGTESGYYGTIAYATSPSGTWYTKNLTSSKASIFNDVTYANGYWVAVGKHYIGGNYYATVAYIGVPTSTWYISYAWGNSSSSTTATSITYANGYYVMGGRSQYNSLDYSTIAYTTNPNAEWTTKYLAGGSNGQVINSITYANGYLAYGGHEYVLYNTSPSDSVTIKHFLNYFDSIQCIAYANGCWVVGGKLYSDSTYHARIFFDESNPPFDNL